MQTNLSNGRADKAFNEAAKVLLGTVVQQDRDVLVAELEVTPEMASRWLEKNTINRPIRDRLIQHYADQMIKEKWGYNGETIKLSLSGELLDGQHRLLAVIRSKKTVRMMVVANLPTGSFTTIDTGMRRTNAQILGMKGYQNSAVLASAGRWLYSLEQGVPAGKACSAQETIECLERHPLTGKFADLGRGKNQLLISGCSAVFVLAAEKYGEEPVLGFLRDFVEGTELKRGNPVYELRERLISSVTKRSKLLPKSIVALTIKSVKAYIAGKTIGTLKFAGNEEWPEI